MTMEIKFKISNNYTQAVRIQNRIYYLILLDEETAMISCEGYPTEFFIVITTEDPLRVVKEVMAAESGVNLYVKMEN